MNSANTDTLLFLHDRFFGLERAKRVGTACRSQTFKRIQPSLTTITPNRKPQVAAGNAAAGGAASHHAFGATQ
jgi:hypothetical protein